MTTETEGMTRTLSLDQVDATFAEVAKALYGDAVDPRELWDISKRGDGSELHVNGDGSGKRKAVAAGLVAGSAAEGLGLGRAYQRAKENRPKVLRITGAAPPRVTDMKGRVRAVRAVAHAGAESKAGRIGEAAFQGANFAVGLTAARELAKKPKQPVGKGFTLKPVNPMDVKRPVSLKARRPGLRLIAKDAGSAQFDPMTGKRLGVGQDPSGMIAGTLPMYDTQTGVKIPRPGAPSGRKLKVLGTPIIKSVTWRGEISKVDVVKGQFFGWASVAEIDGVEVVDRQGDIVPINEIEASAYTYVIESRKGGDMHARVSKAMAGTEPLHTSDLIESMVFTPEKIEALGLPPNSIPLGWWTGFQARLDTPEGQRQIQDFKDGKRVGFSVHGMGERTPVEKRDKRDPKLRDRVEAAVHPPAVKLKPVDSSAIKSMGYQRQTRRLAIEMHSRPSKPYQYRLRPLDAKKAEEAPSLGSHYSHEIRGKAPHANRVRLRDRARLFADPPKKDMSKGLAQVADAAGDTTLAVKRIGGSKAPPGPKVSLRPIAGNLGAAEHDTAVPVPVVVGAGPAGSPIPEDPLA